MRNGACSSRDGGTLDTVSHNPARGPPGPWRQSLAAPCLQSGRRLPRARAKGQVALRARGWASVRSTGARRDECDPQHERRARTRMHSASYIFIMSVVALMPDRKPFHARRPRPRGRVESGAKGVCPLCEGVCPRWSQVWCGARIAPSFMEATDASRLVCVVGRGIFHSSEHNLCEA